MADAIAAGASAGPGRAAERGALRCRNPGGHARRGGAGTCGAGQVRHPTRTGVRGAELARGHDRSLGCTAAFY